MASKQTTMTNIPNPQIDLAYKYIRYTNKNIFLTGKAGTGKTTFLQSIKNEDIKRMAVVAPTGVAAINAGGMTIHSFFQLPFGMMLPGEIKDKIRQQKLNREKINMIKSLDLLIIDEISMVRADLLDAIDEVLRRYRNTSLPFGGVQLLMVGDLHQLPPVVKNEEWHVLSQHYKTMYFFGSQALQKTNPVTIELKHIYRQADDIFIELLNKVRNNQIDTKVLEQLNSRYQPGFKPNDEDGYITLTSHNKVAQEINKDKLQTLPGKNFQFKAEIEGKFPEKAYPTEELLNFKLNAQVMFVKNDISAEKLFYNGKIGKIIRINKESIAVRCPGDGFDITVHAHDWTNVKYKLNEKTKELEEEVIGSFRQIPLKTAWAITIHKSQGLTFEKAIIDAEAAFAHGQVYVALSRCKSFEGIVLRSPIANSSVKTDHVVKQYSEAADRNAPDEKHLTQSKAEYQQRLAKELFDFKPVRFAYDQLYRSLLENESAIQGEAINQLAAFHTQVEENIFAVSKKFLPQLPYYFQQDMLPEENEELQSRIKKASDYFSKKLTEDSIPLAQAIKIFSDNQTIKKSTTEKLSALHKALFIKKFAFESCQEGFSATKYMRAKSTADVDFKKAKTKTPKVKKEIITVDHPVLNTRLVEWRKERAKSMDVPLYRVLSNKAMFAIIAALPSTVPILKIVNGLGPKKIKDFGEDIVEIVNKFCEEEGIDKELRNNFSEEDIKKTLPKKKKIDTKKATFDLYKSGKTVVEISAERGLVRSTIEGHIAHYIGLGELEVNDFIDPSKGEKLKDYFRKYPEANLGDAKVSFGSQYSYGELQMVLAWWKKEKE